MDLVPTGRSSQTTWNRCQQDLTCALEPSKLYWYSSFLEVISTLHCIDIGAFHLLTTHEAVELEAETGR